MNAETLQNAMYDLYDKALQSFDPPKKICGEYEKIVHFGFEAFQAGFLHGVATGMVNVREGSE